MYQDLRPAVKDSEAYVAIVAPSDKNIGALAQKLDSVNFRNAFIQTDKSLEEDLGFLMHDVAILYADGNNAFLFKTICAIKNKYDVPTLVISRDYDEFTAVLALELGADDYLPSLVGVNELRLRVLRLSRKVAPQSKEAVNEVKVANVIRSAFARDRTIYYSFFTPYEFEVLLLLQSSPGKTLSRDTISIAVRGRSTTHADRSIDNIIARVRKKLIQLGFEKYLIRAFHSYGYMFAGCGNQFLDELEEAIKRTKHGI